MKTQNTHTQNEQLTNIKYIFEYDRDKDKTTPHKINRTKDLLNTFAKYSFLTIGFSCGINSVKDTICEFNTYYNGANIKELNYQLFLIWDEYTYIESNILKRFGG